MKWTSQLTKKPQPVWGPVPKQVRGDALPPTAAVGCRLPWATVSPCGDSEYSGRMMAEQQCRPKNCPPPSIVEDVLSSVLYGSSGQKNVCTWNQQSFCVTFPQFLSWSLRPYLRLKENPIFDLLESEVPPSLPPQPRGIFGISNYHPDVAISLKLGKIPPHKQKSSSGAFLVVWGKLASPDGENLTKNDCQQDASHGACGRMMTTLFPWGGPTQMAYTSLLVLGVGRHFHASDDYRHQQGDPLEGHRGTWKA